MYTYKVNTAYPEYLTIKYNDIVDNIIMELRNELIIELKSKYPYMTAGQLIINSIRCFNYSEESLFPIDDSTLVIMLNHVRHHGFTPARIVT